MKAKYTKKPVTIEALQWTGDNKKEVLEFCEQAFVGDSGALYIKTLEGTHEARVGDYIIEGVKGEYYPCKPDIFALTYYDAETPIVKSLHNTTANGARKNVKDIQFWGNGDTFALICKASSEAEGWMKSTKAMEVGNAVVVQVTTQQRNPDGSYSIAEALTTVPNSKIIEEVKDGVVVSRKIV